MTTSAPVDPSAALGATLTLRLTDDERARLDALADARNRTGVEGSKVTPTSLARGAVRRMLSDAAKAKGTGR